MAYTEDALKTFMVTELSSVAPALGLTTTSPSIVEAVAEVAAVLGSAIASLTDDLKTRTVARWQVWRVAKATSAGQYDLKSDGDELKRSQFYDHINAMLADSERAAARYPDVASIIGTGLPLPIPYAGGISQADKQTREDNTDRVVPFFTRSLHEAS